jgi:organic radical activating enzyme
MMLKVNEVFESRQGEGRFAGYPVLFIRLSGCTRKCNFCDTSYHTQYDLMEEKKLAKLIDSKNVGIVVWTGGEPLLQIDSIKLVDDLTKIEKEHHIESNGDLLLENTEKMIKDIEETFDYVCFSPKEKKVAKFIDKNVINKLKTTVVDVKIVTDLDTIGNDMIKYATMLMPLSTYNKRKDLKIMKKLWNYNKSFVIFSPRLHTIIFGKKKGI